MNIEYRLNKSYDTLPNLPNNEVFLSLRNYSYYYQRVGYKLSKNVFIKMKAISLNSEAKESKLSQSKIQKLLI